MQKLYLSQTFMLKKDYRKYGSSCNLLAMPCPWIGDHCQQPSRYMHPVTNQHIFFKLILKLNYRVDIHFHPFNLPQN